MLVENANAQETPSCNTPAAAPATADSVEQDFITEGQAKILKNKDVFYNNVQEFNRDISIAVISTWLNYDPKATSQNKNTPFKKTNEARRGTILEALSATGLRSLRYAKELPGVGLITANDMDAAAVEAIKSNITLNGIPDKKMKVTQSDANQVMYEALLAKKPYSIIDLDPFGSASPFIDAAVQAVASGGLLCVTCTDMAVLCGNHPEVCFEKYGGTSVAGTPFCHEAAIRFILSCIQTSASRYKRCIVPLISLSIDFYCRVFVAVYESAAQTKFAASNTVIFYTCIACKSFETQRLGKAVQNGNNLKFGAALGSTVPQKCTHCESSYHVGGPLYAGRLHDEVFVKQLLSHLKDTETAKKYKTHSRMLGMVTVVSEELPNELFYYDLARIASSVNSSTPPHTSFCSGILNAGYQVSISHASRNSIKTNAPPHIVWDVMRAWIREHPIAKTPPENSVAAKILAKELGITVSFVHHPLSEPPSRKYKLVRFEIPPPNHGPKARPSKRKNEDGANQRESKKKKNKNQREEQPTDTAKTTTTIGANEEEYADEEHDDVEVIEGDNVNVAMVVDDVL